MNTFPQQGIFPLNVIHTFSPECGGFQVSGTGVLSGATSRAWIAANRAIYIPFHLSVPKLVRKLACANGATASGNLDMGIYSAGSGGVEALIVSIGSTAQAGTNALQYLDITDTWLGAGDYYLALAMDGVTGTVFGNAPGISTLRQGGLLQQASAFPLPATATPALISSGFLPVAQLSF